MRLKDKSVLSIITELSGKSSCSALRVATGIGLFFSPVDMTSLHVSKVSEAVANVGSTLEAAA